MQSLLEVPQHQVVSVQRISGSESILLRLIELGFLVGSQICVVGRAPFGGPLLVEVHGGVVALRSAEAQCLQVV